MYLMIRRLLPFSGAALSTLILAMVFGGDMAVRAQTVRLNGVLPSISDQIDCNQASIDYLNDPSLTEAEKLQRMDQALQRSLNKFDECQTAPKTEDAVKKETEKTVPETESSAKSQAESSESKNAAQSEGTAADAASQDGQSQDGGQTSPQEQQSSGTNNGQMGEAAPDGVQEGVNPPASKPPGTVKSMPSSGMSGTEQGGSAGGGQSSPQPNPGFGNQGGSLSSSDMSGTEEKPKELPPSGSGQSTSGGITKWSRSGAPGTENEGNSGQASGGTVNDKVLNNGKLPEDIPSANNDSVLEAQIRQAAINEKDPVIQKKLWNEYRKYKGLPKVE